MRSINKTSKLEIWTGLKFSELELKLITPLVPEATPEEWIIEGLTILQSPTPPDFANYRIVGTTVFVSGETPEEWVIEGSMILQAPTPPTQPIVVDNRIEE